MAKPVTKIRLPANGWRPRDYQIPLWGFLEHGGKRAVTCWHRRSGKDDCYLHRSACASQEAIGSYAYLLPQAKQARKAIWNGVNPKTGKKRIDEAFPEQLRARVSDQEMYLELRNGSTFQLAGSDNYDALVGSSFRGIVFSEYSLSNPLAWTYLRPILAENDGWAAFNFTPRGRNHAAKLMDMARLEAGWFEQTLTVDDTGVFTKETLASELRELVSEYGPEYGMALFRQEYHCFKPDAMVTCVNGAKPISQVVQGDIVLTHTGRLRRVAQTFSKPYVGRMVRIESYGSPAIVCTPEHPVRTCDPGAQTYSWTKAGDIKEGDWLVTPKVHVGKPVIAAPLARVIGWYVAEGCVSGTRLTFSLGKDEELEAEELRRDLLSLGFESDLSRPGPVISVGVNDVGLADFLVGNCGGKQENRRLPMALIRGNEREVWAALIAGDGGRYTGGRRHHSEVVTYTTISQELIYQVHALAATVGYAGTFTTRPARAMEINGRTVAASESYMLQMRRGTGEGNKTRSARHAVLGRVRAVSDEIYSGNVHNLRVDGDESYLVSGRAVHNCSFDAPIMGSYFGHLIEAAERAGRVRKFPHDPAHPVHTGWDIGVDDPTALWFGQVIAGELRLIDYLEATGKGMDHYAASLRAEHRVDWVYGHHFLPHDGANRVIDLPGAPRRIDALERYGVKGTLVPRAISVSDDIDVVRLVLRRSWFNSGNEMVVDGLEKLRQYRAAYDKEKKVLSQKPVHDFTSHGADAFRTLAVGLSNHMLDGKSLAHPQLSGVARQAQAAPMSRQARGVTHGGKPHGYR